MLWGRQLHGAVEPVVTECLAQAFTRLAAHGVSLVPQTVLSIMGHLEH